MPTTKRKTAAMTDDHKAALAAGRVEGRAIRDYLNALESAKPRRGRKVTPESIEKRISAIDAALPDADPMKRVLLVSERLDLTDKLAAVDDTTDLPELEAAFITAAKPYGERKGIRYDAWREVGVPAAVLKAAGITR